MAIVGSFYEFAREHGQRTRAEFLSAVRLPHLYFPSLPELEVPAGITTIRLTPGAAGPAQDNLQGIIAIEKDGGANAFGMMITMGRAPNNDLTIPDKRVSKFHGYFRASGAAWSLTDARSTNGTKLDGVRLEASKPYPLASGARLELSGAIEARFFLPAELHAFLAGCATRAR